MKTKRLQAAAFLGALALAAFPAFSPEPKSDFDFRTFARLPVLEGGRVKPMDSFARTALLSIRGKQSVAVDGETIIATRWLLDSAFKPEAADTYPAFVVDDPEVLGLLGIPKARPVISPIGRSSPSARRSRNRPPPPTRSRAGGAPASRTPCSISTAA
ncbi:MAG: hypothetical protein M0D55_07025 [Elusimicrobiota bacterium]|nr:MAG: hypothetical protein M0D55_07025 [Elusimicrobiota bacterium]